MKVLVLGIDGYIGWALAMRLISRNHEVYGMDSFYTRKRVEEVKSGSVTPIVSMDERIGQVKEKMGSDIHFYQGDVSNPELIYSVIKNVRPDCIVHLAEQRSAPYSMLGLKQATETLTQNMIGTLNLVYAMKDLVPGCHLLKLGTMGEYGTPNIDIPEGFFDIEYRGRRDHLPFPKMAGSWYHWSKVHDSNNLMFANRLWNLSITDVMQGVVYGTRIKEIEKTGIYTRFDIDEVWGTALNRFCTQAVLNEPITPYGKGDQRRGFLSLEDSVNCLTIGLENPPEKGEYRVYNQFDQHYSVNELASITAKSSMEVLGYAPEILHVENPRVEKEEHYYNPENGKLRELGYRPSGNLKEDIATILEDVKKFKKNAEKFRSVIMPKTQWKKSPGIQ